GDWCKVTGRCNGIPARVTLSSGATVTPFADPDIVPNVRHLIADQTAAIDGGKMDGWQNVHGCAAPRYACVSYYRAPAIPNLARLAGAYGVEDRRAEEHTSELQSLRHLVFRLLLEKKKIANT